MNPGYISASMAILFLYMSLFTLGLHFRERMDVAKKRSNKWFSRHILSANLFLDLAIIFAVIASYLFKAQIALIICSVSVLFSTCSSCLFHRKNDSSVLVVFDLVVVCLVFFLSYRALGVAAVIVIILAFLALLFIDFDNWSWPSISVPINTLIAGIYLSACFWFMSDNHFLVMMALAVYPIALFPFFIPSGEK